MPPPNTPQTTATHPNSHFFNTILSPNTHTSSNTTPAGTSAHHTHTPSSHNSRGHGQGEAGQEFTAQQRLAQARGKRWDNIGTGGAGSGSGSGNAARAAGGVGGVGGIGGVASAMGVKKKEEPEDFETRQSRDRAAAVLESMEMLMWYSAVRNESIPQTRLYFQNIVYGVTPSERDVMWREEWEVARDEEGRSPRSAAGKGKEKERERGKKKRVSSGVGS